MAPFTRPGAVKEASGDGMMETHCEELPAQPLASVTER